MLVFARRLLARRYFARASAPLIELMLLLEGAWPEDEAGGTSPPFCDRHALDTAIDGRFARLDVEAERITAEIIAAAAGTNPEEPNFAELNALRLRYAVVKWLRPIAWWRTCLTDTLREPVRLAVESPRDGEYQTLFRQLSEAFGFRLIVESPGRESPAQSIALPANPFWRRLAGRVAASRSRFAADSASSRVMLSGNPRLLDPICAELVDRGATVAWLYDRFSFGCRKRWHGRGVTQLVCDSSLGRVDPFPTRLLNEPLAFEGVDLAPVVNAWYEDLRRSLAPSQGRLWSQIGRHVEAFRPEHVVVDEDATPQARAAILQGRRLGAAATVVQHGICGVRFGFAPLLADRFCAWDDGSRRQMQAWGVSPQSISVTGSPYQERVAEQAATAGSAIAWACATTEAVRRSAPRILLIGTIPPRDDRPDSIAYRLTTRNYEQLLEAALSAVAEIPHDELAIRNHPRTGADLALGRFLAAKPGLRHRDTSRLPIAADLAMSDIVLSFPSSGALDAVRLGKPVIQLAPADSHELAPAEWYGFFGTAGTLPELRKLLVLALAAIPQQGAVVVPRDTSEVRGGATARVVDTILRTGNAADDASSEFVAAVGSDAEAIR